MKLAELQSLFQNAILQDDATPALLAQLRRPPRAMDVGEAFAVYHGGYRLRLAEFLANDFPILRVAMGDEAFGALVEGYVVAQPSHHRNARWFGACLPTFMGQTEPWCDDETGCGLAHMECALAHAFDAPDAVASSLADLGKTPPADWPRLGFILHPAVSLINVPCAVLELYEAAAADPATESSGPTASNTSEYETILVWRSSEESCYRALGEDERLALTEIRQGKTFGEICNLLAFRQEPSSDADDAADLTMIAAGFLARWFDDGLILHIVRSDGGPPEMPV